MTQVNLAKRKKELPRQIVWKRWEWIENKSQEVGRERKSKKKKCKLRFSIIKKNKAFRKNCMKVGVKKLL